MDDAILKFANLLPTARPAELFAALHRLCDDAVGVKLFTCSRFDLDAGKAERIYTSDAKAYPLTGLKDIVANRWTSIVLDEKRAFVSSGIEGLRDVFPDHEKIEALGLGAAINLPVYVQDRLLGTANLLDVENTYTEETVQDLTPFSVCAAMTFMSFNLSP